MNKRLAGKEHPAARDGFFRFCMNKLGIYHRRIPQMNNPKMMKLMAKVLDTSYQAAMPEVDEGDVKGMPHCGPDSPNYPACLNVKHPWEVAEDPEVEISEWERKALRKIKPGKARLDTGWGPDWRERAEKAERDAEEEKNMSTDEIVRRREE